MKKLMFAAALAATTAAFAECKDPDPVTSDIARVYQVQLNTYTTKGKALGGSTISGQCGDATTLPCAVLRGKDKTVIRGYVYICADSCELKDFAAYFADVKRGGIGTGSGFKVNFCNAIGANLNESEINWNLEDTFTYDFTYDKTTQAIVPAENAREQKYTLTGSGYGKVRAGETLFFDSFAGYFAGDAEGSYDFSTPKSKNECACERSQVVTCTNYDQEWRTVLEDANTVAFGAWKMKFNANVSKEMLKRTPDVFALELLLKMFK